MPQTSGFGRVQPFALPCLVLLGPALHGMGANMGQDVTQHSAAPFKITARGQWRLFPRKSRDLGLTQWQETLLRQRHIKAASKIAPDAPPTPQATRRKLADVLFQRGLIDFDALAHALALEKISDLTLGEIVILRGLVDEATMHRIEAELTGAAVVNLDEMPKPAPSALEMMDGRDALRLGALPLSWQGGTLMMAISRLSQVPRVRHALAGRAKPVFLLAPEAQIETRLIQSYGTTLAHRAAGMAPADVSCRNLQSRKLISVGGGLAVLFLSLFLIRPAGVMMVLFALAVGVFLLNTSLRLAVLIASMIEGRAKRLDGAATALSGTANDPIPLLHRPVVSILVPLFEEAEIANSLLKRLDLLDYPRECLEILLIVEEVDLITRNALARADLARHMRVVVVPDCKPRTKPRALNYALNFARGSIIGIYDAEDHPEADQIWRVVRRFATAPEDVACLQGRLDYYNAKHNWLARCFTIEYATWFRVMLRGVQALRLFVPLGGTTVFLRRHALERVGGWDAHNVTEDADLGLRLVRYGLRTELLDTTTYEEANCALWPWLRQRARWLKGYAVTYATAMRAPWRLLREVGAWRFLGLQVQLLCTILGFLLAPLLWSFMVIPFGLDHPLEQLVNRDLGLIAGLGFLLVMLLHWATMIIACEAAHLRPHRRYIPLMEIYLPFATIAAWMAVADLIMRPFYWAKTKHGHFGGAAVPSRT